jgi:hypothetical protein
MISFSSLLSLDVYTDAYLIMGGDGEPNTREERKKKLNMMSCRFSHGVNGKEIGEN